jgi:hypothetical protein
VTWQTAPAIKTLQGQLNKAFPRRDRPDGTIGDAAHSARTSDHNPDADRIVCAVDAKRLSPTISNLEIARALVASRDPRIKYVIADGRMWSSYPTSRYPAWAERPYTGSNAHAEHVHLSVTQAGKNSTASWSAVAALARPTKEDVMSPAQEAKLDRVVELLEALVRPRRPDKVDHDPQAVDLGDLLTKQERAAGCTCKP